MPCYVCNPQCGRCRPPRPAPEKCSECGKLVLGGMRVCTHCGSPMPARQAVFCKFTGRACFIPCVRANEFDPQNPKASCPWGEQFGIGPVEEGA